MTDIMAAWIAAHRIVDAVLQGAVISLALLVILGCICGSAYLALLLRRLTSRANRQHFSSQPIPSIVGGRLWGAEINLGETRQDLLGTESETANSVTALEERMAMLEVSVQHIEARVGCTDVVSQKSPTSGGLNG